MPKPWIKWALVAWWVFLAWALLVLFDHNHPRRPRFSTFDTSHGEAPALAQPADQE